MADFSLIDQALQQQAPPQAAQGAPPPSPFDQRQNMLAAGAQGPISPDELSHYVPGDYGGGDSSGTPPRVMMPVRNPNVQPGATSDQPPVGPPPPSFGHVVASGAEQGIGGLAGLPMDMAQMVPNAGAFLYNKIRDQFNTDPNSLFTKPDESQHLGYVPPLPGGSDWIYNKMEQAGMTPRENFTPEWAKLLKAGTAGVTGQLPTALIPGAGPMRFANLVREAAGGAISGIGSELAQEGARAVDPANPLLQTAAGLFGGAAPTAYGGVVRPFTTAGQRIKTGNILIKEARGVQPAPLGNLPAGFKPTLGQATDAPGHLRMERTFEQNPDYGPDIQAQNRANQKVLRDNLESLHSGYSPDDMSEAMNAGVKAYYDGFKNAERNLWKQIDPGNAVPLVSGVFRQRVKNVIGKEPVAYRKLIPETYLKDLEGLGYNTTFPEIHAILSQAKEDARIASRNGEANKARAIGRVVDAINAEMQNQMMRAVGQNGAAVRQRFQLANRFSAHVNDVFKTNPVGQLLGKDKTGALRVAPTATAAKLLGPGAGQKERWEAFKKAVHNNQASIAAARDYFVSQLIAKVVLADGTVSPDKFKTFVQANSGLFHSDIFTAAQKDLLDRVRNAADIAQRTARGGPKGGPDTAAKLLGTKYIDVLIGAGARTIVHGTTALAGAALGYRFGHEAAEGFGGLYGLSHGGKMVSDAMDKIYAAPAMKIRQLLRDALLDPALARDLMAEAKGARLPARLARYLANDFQLNQSGGLPAATQARTGTGG